MFIDPGTLLVNAVLVVVVSLVGGTTGSWITEFKFVRKDATNGEPFGVVLQTVRALGLVMMLLGNRFYFE
jgi:uncharacterized membrane protein YsdA (DUF1294 family)